MSGPKLTVLIDNRVAKVIKQLPRRDAERIAAAIERLAVDPYPPGSCKLVQRMGWRIRVGDYRILYKVESGQLLVLVFRVGHRREVYD